MMFFKFYLCIFTHSPFLNFFISIRTIDWIFTTADWRRFWLRIYLNQLLIFSRKRERESCRVHMALTSSVHIATKIASRTTIDFTRCSFICSVRHFYSIRVFVCDDYYCAVAANNTYYPLAVIVSSYNSNRKKRYTRS